MMELGSATLCTGILTEGSKYGVVAAHASPLLLLPHSFACVWRCAVRLSLARSASDAAWVTSYTLEYKFESSRNPSAQWVPYTGASTAGEPLVLPGNADATCTPALLLLTLLWLGAMVVVLTTCACCAPLL